MGWWRGEQLPRGRRRLLRPTAGAQAAHLRRSRARATGERPLHRAGHVQWAAEVHHEEGPEHHLLQRAFERSPLRVGPDPLL